ncbi:STAS domain-containing protein [Actinotalea sp. AC32]|nr:STAS domain-containing protein [Actinotalea sp. AC32]
MTEDPYTALGGGEPGAVQVLEVDGATHVVLSGEVDSDLARDLAHATEHAVAAGLPVVVDTRRVTFMDSAGLAFLARLSAQGTGRVRVVVGHPTVAFLLEVTGMGDAVDVVDVGATA